MMMMMMMMIRCGHYARFTATATNAGRRINVPLREGHVHRQLYGGRVKGRLCESVRPVKLNLRCDTPARLIEAKLR